MARPVSRVEWTPGPTGRPVPPTVEDLCAFLPMRTGPAGLRVENGLVSPSGFPTINVVCRDFDGEPIGILNLRLLDGTPEIIDIAVRPEYRRKGIAKSLLLTARQAGFDARDIGAVWEGPLTPEGKALRDRLVAWATVHLGPASWEVSACG